MLSVQETKPVSTSTAETPALVYVVPMQPAVWPTMRRSVAVTRDMRETPLWPVGGSQHVSYSFYEAICFDEPFPPAAIPTEVVDPCNPSPCGSNAVCTQRNRAGSCRCIPEYFGDPYVACRPECTINPECPSNKACRNQKCIDPCPGLCGVNAECRVINHLGTCTCRHGYRGEPFTSCQRPPQSKQTLFGYFILFYYLSFSN